MSSYNKIKSFLKLSVLIASSFIILSCQSKYQKKSIDDSLLIHLLFDYLSEAIIFDGFPPPVASRIYAYCAVAAYSSINQNNAEYKSLSNQLNGLGNLPVLSSGKQIDDKLVLITCFSEVGKSLVYRDYYLDSAEIKLTKTYIPKNLSKKTIADSKEFGSQLAKAIIKWSKTDNYIETRSFPIYTINKEPSSWQPTWPTYGPAIEPHWGSIRTFVIDSATLNSCAKHIPFDTIPGSDFFNQMEFVQEAVSKADSNTIEIAKFWDCNPAPTDRSGRIALSRRQLTPGGHWIGIVRVLSIQQKLTINEASNAYLRCALAFADGFISAWKEKFSSDLIRPETYINRYINPEWKPLLESPLFPEHPSAHSTISAAAATVLIPIFGDSITYVDSVNHRFGPTPREFKSIRQAADEAGISRLYGGIHYKKAIEEGKNLGNRIGKYNNMNLITKVK